MLRENGRIRRLCVGQGYRLGKDLKDLFLAHRRELQAYLTDRLRDSEAAADLTQETFLRYVEQRQNAGTTVVQDRPYLYRTARNLAIDHTRRQARQRTDSVGNEELLRLPQDDPSPETAADARRKLARLDAAVKELPERTRQIFVLGRLEGLSHRDIADRLRISESSVQKHLAKALHHVMQQLR